MMNTEDTVPAKPQNIMQAYKMANQTAGAALNSEDKIRAYDKVISFCNETASCRLDNSIKTNMLLYWAYNNVADEYLRKQDTVAALNYLQRGLRFAREEKEINSVLRKMSDVYHQIGDRLKWLDVRKRIIDNLSIENRREEYYNLAEEAGDSADTADLLEKALQAAGHEKLPLADKCRHIEIICQKLMALYEKNDDKENWQRIKDLFQSSQLLRQQSEL